MSDARVVLCAMPKSGSSYLTRYLYSGLGFGHDAPPRPAGDFPWHYLTADQAREIRIRERFVWQVHLMPTEENLRRLSEGGVDHVVVHMRDPRQAALSWVHHARRLRVRSYGQTDEFYARSFEDQLAETLLVHFPVLCDFAARWQRVGDLDVLETDFDGLVADQLVLASTVAEFCGGVFQHVDVPLDPFYRRGEREEWRRVLTPEQAAWCQDRMDAFGLGDRWSRA
jgi:hypothetical protein